jgi:hypothetical protein
MMETFTEEGLSAQPAASARQVAQQRRQGRLGREANIWRISH